MFQRCLRPGCALRSARVKSLTGAVLLAVAVGGLGSPLHAQFPPPARPPKQAPAPASAVPEKLPTARSILDRHVEAMGGRDAVLRHKSVHARGTLTMPAMGMSGTLEVYAAAPNKSLLKVSLDGVGEVMEGFDGTHAWSISPMTGPMLQEGKELADKRFDADFHSELRPDSRYASMTTLEQTEFDGRPCYKVRLVRKTGREDIEFYDVATGLKAGSIVTRETHMGEVSATSVETDYRKFGSLLHATTLRQQVGPIEQVMRISVVEYDSVEPSVFELPAGIKALLK
jgi:hypothetical protein